MLVQVTNGKIISLHVSILTDHHQVHYRGIEFHMLKWLSLKLTQFSHRTTKTSKPLKPFKIGDDVMYGCGMYVCGFTDVSFCAF
jgi:hypothetical protein